MRRLAVACRHNHPRQSRRRILPRAVPYELGDSEFAPGDSITIQELRGTSR